MDQPPQVLPGMRSPQHVNGGCPKDLFINTPAGEEGFNYLCAGLKASSFTASRISKNSPNWSKPGTSEKLMQIVRASHAKESVPQAGRNDPCPCGSGKKYKRCCGAGQPSIAQASVTL